MDINWQEIWSGIDAVVNYTFSIGGQDVSIADLFVVLIVLTITWGISRLIRRAVEQLLERRGVTDRGTVAVTTRILHYAIMGVGLLTGLSQVGINLSALFAAGAVFAVGIGFALQNLSENFVSGVILLFERSIKPGDVVEVDGTTVRVLRMGMRTTLCRNRDDEEIIVPNAILVSNSVKNYTLQDSLQRLRAMVGVAYESDMKEVMQVLDEMAKGLAWQSKSHSPVVLLTEFGSSSVNFEVSVWIDDPWTAPRRRSQLMEGIWFALEDHEITIAFPQLDVHFDAPVEEAVTQLPKAS